MKLKSKKEGKNSIGARQQHIDSRIYIITLLSFCCQNDTNQLKNILTNIICNELNERYHLEWQSTVPLSDTDIYVG